MKALFSLVQYPKKAKQAHGDFADFIIWQYLSEFLLINGFELVYGLAAQLVWCFHTATLCVYSCRTKGGYFAKFGMLGIPVYLTNK